jgi:hypothetical protein
MLATLVQVPEGPISEVHPVYWVTLLTAKISPTRNSLAPESLKDFDTEESYRMTGASSALEVIEWAKAKMPAAGLLLAEVHVSADDAEARRLRIWAHMPDTPWAREVGADYTE